MVAEVETVPFKGSLLAASPTKSYLLAEVFISFVF
jgi:hypothetical protein